MELVTTQAMKAGFYGGVVVDYPNSTKAKKFFLVLMTGGSVPLPKALGTDEDSQGTKYFICSFTLKIYLHNTLTQDLVEYFTKFSVSDGAKLQVLTLSEYIRLIEPMKCFRTR